MNEIKRTLVDSTPGDTVTLVRYLDGSVVLEGVRYDFELSAECVSVLIQELGS